MRISVWLYSLEQTLCAWSLLLALGACMGVRHAAHGRVLLTALCAGMLTGLPAYIGFPILNLPMLLVTIFLAPMAAWPGLPWAVLPRAWLLLLLLSLLMAGLARMLEALSLSGATLPAAVALLLPYLARAFAVRQEASCVSVEMLHQGHRLWLTALVDSGNLLRDPLTGLPVIVVSRTAAARLIPLPPPGSLNPGMRLISVRTIAGSSLMIVFRPTRIRLRMQGSWHEVQAIIGLSPDGYDGFQALVPACLIHTQALSTTLSQGG